MRARRILGVFAAALVLSGAESNNQLVTVKPAVVRTVQFRNFRGISVKEIVNRLNDRDIQLVARPYSPQYVKTAQGIVEEFLAEKGQAGIHVTPTVTRIPPHAVGITFTAAR